MGKTTDGKFVVTLVLRFYGTDGIPLDVLFEFLKNNNYVPDWISFVKDAMGIGMKFDRVMSLLDSAIVDSYGSDFRDVVISNLIKVFKK